jgi:hypothetical protein
LKKRLGSNQLENYQTGRVQIESVPFFRLKDKLIEPTRRSPDSIKLTATPPVTNLKAYPTTFEPTARAAGILSLR